MPRPLEGCLDFLPARDGCYARYVKRQLATRESLGCNRQEKMRRRSKWLRRAVGAARRCWEAWVFSSAAICFCGASSMLFIPALLGGSAEVSHYSFNWTGVPRYRMSTRKSDADERQSRSRDIHRGVGHPDYSNECNHLAALECGNRGRAKAVSMTRAERARSKAATGSA